MIRQPAVAGRFYPGTKGSLASAVEELLAPCARRARRPALAAVSPHAGYFYSGGVAAETLAAVEIPETVVILGVNHHGLGDPAAVSTATWKMPMGEVPADREFCDLLLSGQGPFTFDEEAHRHEHSLEVQVPFLQALQPNLAIVPIALSHFSYALCIEAADALAAAIQQFPQKVLIVASSDMSHYESRETAGRKDNMALEKIKALDPEGLYDTVHAQRISMCGVIPVTTTLLAAIKLGAKKAEIIRYTDSGEASGDTGQVVGYAGVVIS